jgi:hypothetical protein
VSIAQVVSASARCGLRELRGVDRRRLDADPDARFLGRVTMIGRHVGDQNYQLRQQRKVDFQ